LQQLKEVKEFVESTDGRLRLYFLPPYSPELNPDEWVWKNVKNDKIGRTAVRSKNELEAVACFFMATRRSTTDDGTRPRWSSRRIHNRHSE